MTELEMINRAKTYIDKLANGVNPLTDEPVSENDIVNNVRISRCFFYISDLLRRFAEGGFPEAAKKGKKQPFIITEEQRKRFEFSETPISVSEIARRFNAAVNTEGAVQMRYSGITFWLIESGLLSVDRREDGREVKLPTAAGMELGISQEVRSGANGSYTVVVYNENAQRYIVDNIDAILEAEKLRFKMQGMPWSQAEDEFLEEQAARGIPVYDIALALKRNISSVRARTKKLGLVVSK
ncbi:MAG: hypothetical protein Q4C32_02355 [Eubacteriales bacterium]|nr:hypothetical protein [Eubacteriales bacterium]